MRAAPRVPIAFLVRRMIATVVAPLILLPVAVEAQTDTTRCTYALCGLKLEDGRIVRGLMEDDVGDVGLFSNGLGILRTGPDSAAAFADRVRRLQHEAVWWGIGSAAAYALATGSALWLQDPETAPTFGMMMGAVASPAAVLGLEQSIVASRSAGNAAKHGVAWYNRQFPDAPPPTPLPSVRPVQDPSPYLIVLGSAVGGLLGYGAAGGLEGAYLGSAVGSFATGLLAPAFIRWR